MKIYNPIKAISQQLKYNEMLKPAVKYSKQRKKIEADIFQKRFSMTKAGYFPPTRKIGFFENLSNKVKDLLYSLSLDD